MDKFERQTHRTSRALEYFSEKEIQMQIGVSRHSWPIAIVKELVDNALDACEDANIPPHIQITVNDNYICVQDNGPGLPAKTIEESLDFLYRVSDKSHYVSPSRGQLGNALKCIYAIPFILNGSHGGIDISTQGQIHKIEFSLNLLIQEPEVRYTTEDSFIKSGTNFKVNLNLQTCLHDEETTEIYKRDAENLISNYALLNPHASFTCHGCYERTSDEINKWCPSDKIPAHWYSEERLRNLIAAYIHAENHGGRVRTIREFISEFAGYTGPGKQQQVTKQLGIGKGAYLNEFIKDGDVDIDKVKSILVAMSSHSKILKPRVLGKVGEKHITEWMVKQGGVVAESIKYQLKSGQENDLPYILEVAFGIFGDKEKSRKILSGLNWAPTLKDPMRLISSQTTEALIDQNDPILLIVHLIYPQLKFTGKGKGEIEL